MLSSDIPLHTRPNIKYAKNNIAPPDITDEKYLLKKYLFLLVLNNANLSVFFTITQGIPTIIGQNIHR